MGGLEPPTSRVWIEGSNQLSYTTEVMFPELEEYVGDN